MKFVHDYVRMWILQTANLIAIRFRGKAYVLGAIVVSLLIFVPLVNQMGLFELGDANFPLHPFALDYFLPWQERAAAGVDNVFIGVPRLAYYGTINIFLFVVRNAQIAQWLWYAAVGALGVIGAHLLARRLGAARFAFPLALFYAFNLWSYDRVAQTPLFLAYESMPLTLYLLLVALERQRFRNALAFGLSVVLVLPAFQIAYLTLALSVIIVGYALARRRIHIATIGKLVVCVFLCNAFFIAPMVADFFWRNSTPIRLVSARFSDETFVGYSVHATLGYALRLAGFFYSSLSRQPMWFQWMTFLPAIAVFFAANLSALWRRPAFIGSLIGICVGLWMVAGITLTPRMYQDARHLIPGLSLFVEPDYFTPLVIVGMLGVLATSALVAARSYGRAWGIGVWLMCCAGIAPFLPWWGLSSGLPQSLIPSTYVRFQQSAVSGRTLWLPDLWVARYRWSPYLINGFTVLNSPTDALGPQMLEWTPPHTLEIVNHLVAAFEEARTKDAAVLMRVLSIGTVAIAADQLPVDGSPHNPLVSNARRTLARLLRASAIGLPTRYSEPYSEIIAAQTQTRLPIIGIFPAPQLIGESALATAALAKQPSDNYRPLDDSGESFDPLTRRPCVAGPANVHRVASVDYEVTANIAGDCSLIFRDTFAPTWRVRMIAGRSTVQSHFEADGFANGWYIHGAGATVLRVYNALAAPFLAGLALLAAGIAMQLTLAIRDRSIKRPTAS